MDCRIHEDRSDTSACLVVCPQTCSHIHSSWEHWKPSDLARIYPNVWEHLSHWIWDLAEKYSNVWEYLSHWIRQSACPNWPENWKPSVAPEESNMMFTYMYNNRITFCRIPSSWFNQEYAPAGELFKVGKQVVRTDVKWSLTSKDQLQGVCACAIGLMTLT